MVRAHVAWSLLIVLALTQAAVAASDSPREESSTYIGTGGTGYSCGSEWVAVDELGGACFEVMPGEFVVNVSVEDAAGGRVAVAAQFVDVDGEETDVIRFCDSSDLSIPDDMVELKVWLAGPTEGSVPPSWSCANDPGVATMGEIVAIFV